MGFNQLRFSKTIGCCQWLSSFGEAEELGKAVAEAAKILMDDEKLTELGSEELSLSGSRISWMLLRSFLDCWDVAVWCLTDGHELLVVSLSLE